MTSWGRALRRPESTALAGVVVVWLGFALVAGRGFTGPAGTAAILNATAPLGLLAVSVALLMIGGEFDLSVGSVLGASSMAVAVLVTHAGWSVPAAIVAALAVAGAVGLANGVLVVRTGLPSFIVTLGTLYVVRGLTIAVPRHLTGRTQIGQLDRGAGYEAVRGIVSGDLVAGIRAPVLWWLLAAAVGSWVLHRTRTGNWILATGGDAESARRSGVPVRTVKVGLFVATSLAAGWVGVMQAIRFTGADALRGELQELRAIVAVVVGGTLLTGGYGSVIGAVLGALLFGMVQQGLVMSGIDADWFQVFLGSMLVGAVLVNAAVRRRASRA